MDSLVAGLKSDGNASFLQKDYRSAVAKYSEAIECLPSSKSTKKDLAVLHANRAACYLNLRQYMDAFCDSETAGVLDPSYSKAWARRATAEVALGRDDSAAKHWEKALACLPMQNLSSSEQLQKDQYTAGLRATKEKAQRKQPRHLTQKAGALMPWELAQQLLPSLREEENFTSSAFAISEAYTLFMGGMSKILAIQHEGPVFYGQPKALREMLNGILIDTRVFHVSDKSFPKQFSAQIKFECHHVGAMDLVPLGPEDLINNNQSLLTGGQFEQRREAVELLLCIWVLRGHIEGGFFKRPDITVEYLSNALKVLEWGRNNLSELPESSIFDDSFVWSIRRLYLDAYMSSYTKCRGTPAQRNVPLRPLLTESDTIIREIQAKYPNWSPGNPNLTNPSVINSFVHAHSMQGYYYAQIGEATQDENTRQTAFRLASQSYEQAGRACPQDDEEHSWFLQCALSNAAHSGAMPYEAALPLLKEIRESVPEMLKIWANSSLSQGGRDDILAGSIAMESRLLESMETGVICKDGIFANKDWDP